jgi:hypothetical protein
VKQAKLNAFQKYPDFVQSWDDEMTPLELTYQMLDCVDRGFMAAVEWGLRSAIDGSMTASRGPMSS